MTEMSILDISAAVTVGTCCILAHQGVYLFCYRCGVRHGRRQSGNGIGNLICRYPFLDHMDGTLTVKVFVPRDLCHSKIIRMFLAFLPDELKAGHEQKSTLCGILRRSFQKRFFDRAIFSQAVCDTCQTLIGFFLRRFAIIFQELLQFSRPGQLLLQECFLVERILQLFFCHSKIVFQLYQLFLVVADFAAQVLDIGH